MTIPLPKAVRAALETRANEHVGLLAEFSDPGALTDAVVALRKRGYTRLDTFTPFPIHGMDTAMGLPVSKLGFLVFPGALLGLLGGFLLQWWTSAVDYPINISNKPFFAIEASVPIMFELTILFAALTAVGGMLALNGLPKPYDPLFYSDRFGRATDDGFFLHVGEGDREFARGATAGDLFGLGALAVEYVDHAGATDVSESGEPTASDDSGPGGGPPPAPVTPPHTTGGHI